MEKDTMSSSISFSVVLKIVKKKKERIFCHYKRISGTKFKIVVNIIR